MNIRMIRSGRFLEGVYRLVWSVEQREHKPEFVRGDSAYVWRVLAGGSRTGISQHMTDMA